jgi:hypothetical protein
VTSVWRLVVALVAVVLVACAQGDVTPQGQHSDSDAAGADVASDALVDDAGLDSTSPPGPDATADVAAQPDTDDADPSQPDATPDAGDDDADSAGGADTDPSDADPSDVNPPDADQIDAGGGCGGGCADGVCDPATGECVECLDHGDCADGLCHDQHQVCVTNCCTETVADSFSDVSYSHNRFDIALDSAQAPAIVFADTDADKLRFAQPLNGQWLAQDIGSEVAGNSPDVRLAITPDDTPHVILGRYQTLRHLWRDANGWQSHDLLVDPDSVSYVDIAADDAGNVHFVSLLDYGDQILYARQDAQGQRTEQYLTLPPTNPPVWVEMAVTSDNRPVISFQIGLDKTLVVAEKTPAGTWDYDTLGQDVAQVHGVAVGPNDEPAIAYHHADNNDGLRLLSRQGATWQDELIVADVDHGFTPAVAIDDLGDPHIAYMARGSGQYDNPMYYARFDGVQWEYLQVNGVDRAFYPRVVIDDQRRPHIVVYDPPRDSIAYVRLD